MGNGSGKRDAWIVIGLTLVAFALRVYRLGAMGLYGDEFFNLAVGTLPFPEWLNWVFDDRNHPPGYYVICQWWYGIGRAEFIIRYLSVIFGVLAIPLLYRLGQVLVDKRVGLIAATLLAISPFHIEFSQIARMYSLVALCAIGASYFFLRLLARGRAQDALGYAALTACGLYTHYFHVWLVLAQMVFVVLEREKYRAALTRWFAALLGAGALFAPWLVVFFTTGGLTPIHISWIPPAQLADLPLTLFTSSLGATSLVNNPLFFFIPAAYAALALGGWASARQSLARTRANFVALWFLLPLIFVFLISFDLPIENKRAIYADRYFIGELPAWLLLIALGIRALWQRRPRWAMVLAGALLAVTMLVLQAQYSDPANAPEDWRGSVAYLNARADTACDVLTIYAGEILPLAYYEPSVARRIVVALPSAEAAATFDRQFAALDSVPMHVWLLLPTANVNVHGFPTRPDEQRQNAYADPLKRALDQRFTVEEEKLFSNVFIAKYRVVK